MPKITKTKLHSERFRLTVVADQIPDMSSVGCGWNQCDGLKVELLVNGPTHSYRIQLTDDDMARLVESVLSWNCDQAVAVHRHLIGIGKAADAHSKSKFVKTQQVLEAALASGRIGES